MPKVWNKRDPNCPMDAVYVGRPSKWGNPWSHLPSARSDTIPVATREEAIQKFRDTVMQDDTFWSVRRHEIRLALKGKDLVCWCAPKPCHADILLEIANGTEETIQCHT